jgi:arylsulfatase A-like enzyme
VPPNVLVLILDAARRDALEPYGAPKGSTPVIADLAASGAALPDVYSTACWTAPSHVSIFTGKMPRAAGLGRVPAPSILQSGLESLRDRALPEVLRKAGYETKALSANLWVSMGGFDHGFDEFEAVDSGRVGKLDATGLRDRVGWYLEAARAKADDGARHAEEVFGRWADAPQEKPFFWFVNLIECHSPYLPPRPYGGFSLLSRLRAAEAARRYYTLQAIWKVCIGGDEVPESTLERLRHFYAESIRYMDDWLGGLLERLDKAGKLENTLVVVTADHGENFGEGGFITHGHSLDNRLINVPFVLSGPGAGDREINSLADLPRFVAESAGIESHPWNDGPPPGFGVAQFDAPVDFDDQRAIDLMEEWGLGDDARRRFTTPLTAAAKGQQKLLLFGDEERFYDLPSDPLELSPLSAAEAEAAGHGEALAELRGAIAHPSMASAGGPAGPTEASAEELAEIEERMRLLGYM